MSRLRYNCLLQILIPFIDHVIFIQFAFTSTRSDMSLYMLGEILVKPP
jgi:hypothetical protein